MIEYTIQKPIVIFIIFFIIFILSKNISYISDIIFRLFALNFMKSDAKSWKKELYLS